MLLLVFFFVTIVTVVVGRTPEVHLSPAQLAELFPRIPQDSAAGNGHLHSGHLVQGSAGSGDLVGSGSGHLVRTLLLFPLQYIVIPPPDSPWIPSPAGGAGLARAGVRFVVFMVVLEQFLLLALHEQV